MAKQLKLLERITRTTLTDDGWENTLATSMGDEIWRFGKQRAILKRVPGNPGLYKTKFLYKLR